MGLQIPEFDINNKMKKFETRNPKFETNTKTKNEQIMFQRFGHLDLEIVSDSDIRTSDFK